MRQYCPAYVVHTRMFLHPFSLYVNKSTVTASTVIGECCPRCLTRNQTPPPPPPPVYVRKHLHNVTTVLLSHKHFSWLLKAQWRQSLVPEAPCVTRRALSRSWTAGRATAGTTVPWTVAWDHPGSVRSDTTAPMWPTSARPPPPPTCAPRASTVRRTLLTLCLVRQVGWGGRWDECCFLGWMCSFYCFGHYGNGDVIFFMAAFEWGKQKSDYLETKTWTRWRHQRPKLLIAVDRCPVAIFVLQSAHFAFPSGLLLSLAPF